MQTSLTGNGVQKEYVYTASDARVGVFDVPNQWWRWTIRDLSDKPVRDYTSTVGWYDWRWTKDYIWRDGLLVATRQMAPGTNTGVTYHYHLDHLGTPRRITDDGDKIVGYHDYYAFGPDAPGGKTEPSLTLTKYTGHERDVIDGYPDPADYMMARYYSPRLGRFLTVDPVMDIDTAPANPQTWNRYAYARNNPIARIDPDGKRDIYVAIWRARFPYFTEAASVGHVGAFELSGRVILSQFPTPHGMSGRNDTKTFNETLAAERRPPDELFKVFVPNDQAFDDAVATQKYPQKKY
jgi:RHS repeat-associated protein